MAKFVVEYVIVVMSIVYIVVCFEFSSLRLHRFDSSFVRLFCVKLLVTARFRYRVHAYIAALGLFFSLVPYLVTHLVVPYFVC